MASSGSSYFLMIRRFAISSEIWSDEASRATASGSGCLERIHRADGLRGVASGTIGAVALTVAI